MSVPASTIHYILYGSQGKAMTIFSVNRAALFICAPPPSFLISHFSFVRKAVSHGMRGNHSRSQMQYAVFDFLGTALIPELGADVAAGSSGDAHFVLVAIAAVRAFPDELAVFVFDDLDLSIIAADHAVVALGIQLCVHDIFIDVLHDGENGRDIRLHVRDFDVGDRAARGELLEIGFKFQLVEGIDLLCDVDMVAVGDVVLICDAFDEPEALLEAFGKFIGGGFHRGAVDGVGDVFLRSPFAAFVIQLLHDGQGEFPALFRGVGDTEHADAHFIQAGIAEGNGAVVIEEELVDGLALLEARECAVLP